MKITDANGCSVFSNAIYLNSLSVDQHHDASIEIYPNPFMDELIIGYKEVFKAELYSMEGRKVGVYNNTPIIYTADLTKGIYFIKIYNHLNELKTVQKIVKQ